MLQVWDQINLKPRPVLKKPFKAEVPGPNAENSGRKSPSLTPGVNEHFDPDFQRRIVPHEVFQQPVKLMAVIRPHLKIDISPERKKRSGPNQMHSPLFGNLSWISHVFRF